MRLGHSQRKGGGRRIGERRRETAPFVRAGDVPLNTMYPHAQGDNGVSQSRTWPWPVQRTRSQQSRAARGGGSDENSDRAGHDGTSAASDTGLECTVTVNVLAVIIF